MDFVTVSVFPAINRHQGWARPLSVHFILSVAWAPARTGGLTVQASARDGRACPSQQLGSGTMSLETSLSPDQWL